MSSRGDEAAEVTVTAAPRVRAAEGEGEGDGEGVEARVPERFEVRRELGRGGMGVVVAAFDTTLRREVAVKVLSGQRGRDPGARAQMLEEARAVARLSHPNIVRVLEVDVGAGCIVMELVEGETLEARCRRGAVGAPELRRIGGQVLDALEAAHRASLLHCDVKPANVMLASDGVVRLADFGVARGIGDGRSATAIAGTPAYQAPECSEGIADVRSDVYSVGATMFRAATGAPPDGARAETLHGRLRDRALEAAILRALETDPAKRPQSAAEFRAALVRRGRRWPWIAAAIAVVAIAVVAWRMMRASESVAGPIAMLPIVDRTEMPALAFAPAGVPYLLSLDLEETREVIGYYRVRAAIDGELTDERWDAAARALGARTVMSGRLERGEGGVRVALWLRSLDDGRELRRAEGEARPAEVAMVARGLARELIGVAASTVAVRAGEVDLALAVAALEQHALDDAEPLVERALAADPGWSEAHYVAALVAWWRGRSETRTLEHARAARIGVAQAARLAFLDGLELLVGKRSVEAIEHFRGAVALYPDDRDVRYGLFEALWHAGRGADAMAAYGALMAIAPRFQIGLDHVCSWAYAHGDDAALARCVELANAVGVRDRVILRARAAAARGDTNGAVAQLTEALAAKDPRVAELLALVHATRFEPRAMRARMRDAGALPEAAALAALADALATGAPTARVQELRGEARAKMIVLNDSRVFWLRYLAVELALPVETHAAAILDAYAPFAEHDVRSEVARVLAAAQRGEALGAARTSPFEEVRLLAIGLEAERRDERAAAAAAFARAASLSVDGRFMLNERYFEARAWHALGDAAKARAACAHVIRPRVLDWSWSVFVRPCLAWTAEGSDDADAAAARAALAALRYSDSS